MAMTNAGLSAKLETEIKSFFGGDPETAAWLKRFCDAIGKAVVEYVQENADIVLKAGDIPVPGAGIIDGNGRSCSGNGANGATTISQGIK